MYDRHSLKLSCIAFLSLIVVASPSTFATDAKLLKRPRNWWEWNPAFKSVDSDHNGRGWDWLYKYRMSTDERNRQYYLKSAEGEFKYSVEAWLVQWPRVDRTTLGLLKLGEEIGFLTNRPSLALSAYKKAFKIRPRKAILHVFYAQYLQRLENLPGAIRSLQAAIKIAPSNSAYHYLLARYYFQNNQYHMAQKQLQIAKKLGAKKTEELERKLRGLAGSTMEKTNSK